MKSGLLLDIINLIYLNHNVGKWLLHWLRMQAFHLIWSLKTEENFCNVTMMILVITVTPYVQIMDDIVMEGFLVQML